MIRKFLITLAVFLLAATAVLAPRAATDPSSGLPRPIEIDFPCPAAGCVSGECHGFGFDAVPEPDGMQALLFVNPHSVAVERFMKSCGLELMRGVA